ncbi:hypothetical protein LZ32DRAFT_670191 [Colletotrichum eremochloae]|nr:hypothetical protein LZ32DRAFT_670191 [Colletotrichum eremochloae]
MASSSNLRTILENISKDDSLDELRWSVRMYRFEERKEVAERKFYNWIGQPGGKFIDGVASYTLKGLLEKGSNVYWSDGVRAPCLNSEEHFKRTECRIKKLLYLLHLEHHFGNTEELMTMNWSRWEGEYLSSDGHLGAFLSECNHRPGCTFLLPSKVITGASMPVLPPGHWAVTDQTGTAEIYSPDEFGAAFLLTHMAMNTQNGCYS